ncbi:MAG: type II toxin-antitoxin system HicB family antitoxin [Candidatus Eremiobacterota bacterium]
MDTTQKKRELYHLINELPEHHLPGVIQYLKSLINNTVDTWSKEEEKNFLEVEKALKKPFTGVSGKEYSVTVEAQPYRVILYDDTECGGYWIDCPSLPGCASQGDTEEEALEMIKDSISGHLEILKNGL